MIESGGSAMTIDEAIKHAEEVMVENWKKTKDRNASDPIAISCGECADEHRQLAEWLKELEQLREQTKWIPVIQKYPNPKETENVIAKYYLIQNEYGDMMVASWDGKGWEQMYQHEYIEDEVIAWMPLPKPYNAESEE